VYGYTERRRGWKGVDVAGQRWGLEAIYWSDELADVPCVTLHLMVSIVVTHTFRRAITSGLELLYGYVRFSGKEYHIPVVETHCGPPRRKVPIQQSTKQALNVWPGCNKVVW
jgi:hypothetical protein